ncbi:MAG: substrate-binding domain-containing protein, partial [Sphingopyxis sp.]|nr:substrate-binding domain-containing protein [Sphingopyxis sp.]
MKRRELLSGLALLPAAAWASTLPPPAHGLPGRVRLAGTAGMAPVAVAWKRAFEAANPAIRVDLAMAGSDVAMANLYAATCDVALIGRDATKPEIQAFEWIYRFRPKGVPILAGSASTPGRSPALAAMVHRSNRVAALSVEQLRAAFGDEGTRARTWGDLGLDGVWRDRPIHLYAPEAEIGTGRHFRHPVLAGSNRMPWRNMPEFEVPPRPAKAEARVAAAMRQALARDPAGLAIGVQGREAGVRVVPLAGADGATHLPDAASLGSGTYPLARTVHAYFAAPANRAAHAETLAFLRFILTPEAQAIAAKASDYLSLSAGAAQEAR